MTTGTSLILIAILFALGFGVYQIHKKKKWKLVGKIAGVICIILLIISGVAYAYYQYQNRPYKVDTLGQISLGMSPVDVTLVLGKPDSEVIDSKDRTRYLYTEYGGRLEYLVSFEKYTGASLICSDEYRNEVFGLGVYDSEEKIITKLGEPTNVSVNEEGLIKFISYNQYNVAFGIEQGDVRTVCVTSSGEVTFSEEYR